MRLLVARSSVGALARRILRRLRRPPGEAHLAWRRLWYAPADVVDRLAGRRDDTVPPRWLAIQGDGDYRAVGEELAGLCVDVADLRPNDAVLDVGCGPGRLATALARRLGPAGRYVGFDVVPEVVEWCRAHLGARDPRLSFDLVDAANRRYRPPGGRDAATVTFPYPDASFDLVCATSILTHLAPDAARRYLAEAARVLRPGGRILATLLVVDASAEAAIREGRAAVRLARDAGGWWTYADKPGDAEFLVAWEPSWLARAVEAAGLVESRPFAPGRWRGAGGPCYQDVWLLALPGLAAEPSDGPQPKRSERP